MTKNNEPTIREDPLTSPDVTWEELGRGFIEVPPELPPYREEPRQEEPNDQEICSES